MSVSIPNIIQVVGVVFIVGCFAFVFVQLYSCVRIACLLVYFLSLCFFGVTVLVLSLSLRLETFHKVCRGPHRMVVGFTTTCAISAYHH
jgi:hypothetical protein